MIYVPHHATYAHIEQQQRYGAVAELPARNHVLAWEKLPWFHPSAFLPPCGYNESARASSRLMYRPNRTYIGYLTDQLCHLWWREVLFVLLSLRHFLLIQPLKPVIRQVVFVEFQQLPIDCVALRDVTKDDGINCLWQIHNVGNLEDAEQILIFHHITSPPKKYPHRHRRLLSCLLLTNLGAGVL